MMTRLARKLTASHRVRRIFKWILLIELAWLVLINTALQLDLTQDLVNKIRPEKFHISWEQAWSPWPGRVYAYGLSGNGNSRSQTWAFEADSASGSISLLPLILKRVWVRNVQGSNATYWQRPRSKPDRDYSAIEAWFPTIEGREPTPAITGPYRTKRPWRVSVRDINLEGNYQYWIYNIRGQAEGTIKGNLTGETRGGPFSLDISNAKLALGLHTINDADLFQSGTLDGSVGFMPFRPRENRGVKMLDYALLDTQVDFHVDDLSFINLFLLKFESITVNGRGRVHGHIHFDEGWIQPGTDLGIDAEYLAARVMEFRIEGNGTGNLVMDASAPGEMHFGLAFDELAAQHSGDSSPTLIGNGLDLVLGGDGKLVPDPENHNTSRSVRVSISNLTVPDLSLLQRYLPENWPLRLTGGRGTVSGSSLLAATEFGMDLKLQSSEAQVAIGEFNFDTDMEAAIRLVNPDVTRNRTRLGGSYLAFRDSRLQRDDDEMSDSWSASLTINEGGFDLFQRDIRSQKEHVVDLFELLRDNQFANLMGTSSGEFEFEGELSSLAWMGVLLSENHNSKVAGSSTLTGQTTLENGLLQAGTWLDIQSEGLGVTILDYISQGRGSIRLDIEEGGERPDWRVGIQLQGGSMKRINSAGPPPILDVEMQLDAVVHDVSLKRGQNTDYDLAFKIPSARLTDVSVFNQDLPPEGPFRFIEGEADLSADILLQSENAGGYLRLVAPDTRAILDDQEIEAAMQVNIQLAGGTPRNRTFDFTGSEILVNDVRIKGNNREVDDEQWSARLVLTHGLATWVTPASIDLEADLTVSDSRPLVAMFENEGWKPEFLTRAMTVEDIQGNALLEISNREMVIPMMTLKGGDIEAAAKAWIRGEENRGMLWARYKSLQALIRFADGKRNLDVIHARRTFDQYDPADSPD